ncbi:class II fructose-bisphosphate aldolase [Paenibacillus andongensis]|uniref:class II fructose-bisphosphate aldolase n=1 Tax=Paenibacillus andongensis TaxID=2975482 RepID=UPI0021BB6266|nr:class II fructose-bisphosphate aldolase [Paenibacillus andongensis]
MSLYTMKELLQDAYAKQYAIPAFNFDNFDLLMGVFEGATEAQSPLILQITQPAIEFFGIENVVDIVRNEAAIRKLPTALHLDHADNLEIIESAIKTGFTSVMIDYSEKDFADNARMTQKVVELARPFNVTVEAEIGQVGVTADPLSCSSISTDMMTDPQAAITFKEATDVDVLAVSIGTIHGMKVKEMQLDIERLQEINAKLGIPLVLHGSSGAREADLKKVINYGITKTNVETELRVTFRNTLEKMLAENPNEIKPRNIMKHVREAIKQKVIQRQTLLKSAGRIAMSVKS